MSTPDTQASDALAITVAEAAEEAGIRMTFREARALATALSTRFPALTEEPPKARASWKEWTGAEEDTLRSLYESNTPRAEIAAQLQRSLGAINGAISRLKLVREAP